MLLHAAAHSLSRSTGPSSSLLRLSCIAVFHKPSLPDPASRRCPAVSQASLCIAPFHEERSIDQRMQKAAHCAACLSASPSVFSSLGLHNRLHTCSTCANASRSIVRKQPPQPCKCFRMLPASFVSRHAACDCPCEASSCLHKRFHVIVQCLTLQVAESLATLEGGTG